MSQIKVTVAIPVYNGEKHLQANFDSLMHQTMPTSDFEVIYVNNCSTDQTREIIEAFAKQMPNVKLINKAVNSGGPFQSMNDALDAAQGKYIHYLDSDDFLCNNALERLYEAAEQYGSDVIYGKYIGVNERWVPTQMVKNGNLEKADIEKDRLFFSLAPHKMFRVSFLRKHGFRFHTQSMAGNEDQLFTLQCYVAAETITVLADLNHYFVVARGNENITSRVYPHETYFVIPRRIIEFLETQIAEPERRKKLKFLYLNRFFKIDRLHKFLLEPAFPQDQKKAWMLEGRKFLQMAMSETDMDLISPESRELAKAVWTADLDKINQLAIEKHKATQEYLEGRKVNLVTSERKNLKTYLRPFEPAGPAASIPNPQRPFRVYYSIPGWFEVRLPHEVFGTHSVFVKKSDVRYTLSFMMQASMQRFKRIMAKAGA